MRRQRKLKDEEQQKEEWKRLRRKGRDKRMQDGKKRIEMSCGEVTIGGGRVQERRRRRRGNNKQREAENNGESLRGTR